MLPTASSGAVACERANSADGDTVGPWLGLMPHLELEAASADLTYMQIEKNLRWPSSRWSRASARSQIAQMLQLRSTGLPLRPTKA